MLVPQWTAHAQSLGERTASPAGRAGVLVVVSERLRPDEAAWEADNTVVGTAVDAYVRVRAAIVDGALLPHERLIELDLAQSLGVSRAAIRTVLARLEHEGLVERHLNRGARVRHLSLKEAIEILEARAALEGLAVSHAATQAGPEDIAGLRYMLVELRHWLDVGDALNYSDTNERLHQQLLEVAGHSTASHLIDLLRSQVVRYHFRTVMVPGRLDSSFEEHTAIVEAVAAHDPERAERAMRQHLLHVVKTLKQAGPLPSWSSARRKNRAPEATLLLGTSFSLGAE